MSATIPIFYINLASRPDRRALMEEEFARLGITAERIEAVCADEVSDADMRPHLDPHNPWALTRVEVACVLSHKRAWRLLLERDLPEALVLEDDALLGDALPGFLRPGLAGELGADIVRLEATKRKVRLGRKLAVVSGRFAVRPLLSSTYGAAAYVISQAMVRRTLNDRFLDGTSVDNYMFFRGSPVFPSPRIVQVEPAPSIQLDRLSQPQNSAAQSDLHSSRSSVTRARPRSAMRGLRKFWGDFGYFVRSALCILTDAEALRTSRRQVTYDSRP
jgi:hypothetical protein